MGNTLVTKTRRGFLVSLGGLAGLTATSMTAQTFQTAQAEKIHVEEDVSKLWSKPVNGVRARLVATRDEFTLDRDSLGQLRPQNLVFDLEVADLRGQLFLGGSGDQQQQAVVQILHRDILPKSLISQEMTSFLHPAAVARKGSRPH